jgi:hypothetical protein
MTREVLVDDRRGEGSQLSDDQRERSGRRRRLAACEKALLEQRLELCVREPAERRHRLAKVRDALAAAAAARRLVRQVRQVGVQIVGDGHRRTARGWRRRVPHLQSHDPRAFIQRHGAAVAHRRALGALPIAQHQVHDANPVAAGVEPPMERGAAGHDVGPRRRCAAQPQPGGGTHHTSHRALTHIVLPA